MDADKNSNDAEGHESTQFPIRSCGINLEFPHLPYRCQLLYMQKVIQTLDKAVEEGHCHALLESPTGTGKTLALLCSTLGWLKNKEKTATEAGSSAPATPIIYYALRTHSQIMQAVRQYKKTSYRVKMSVLASRKHYCTNANVRKKSNIDEECKLLLNDSFACPEYKNVKDVKNHPSIQKGGELEAHDIEDLMKIGLSVKGCSYYASRAMAVEAQLVFCPYNYIVNPIIRAAMGVDIKGAIVILDEAHNIEDVARDAGSVDLEDDALDMLRTELQQLCDTDKETYQPLYEMIQDIMSWISQKNETLQWGDNQLYVSWPGDEAKVELKQAKITSGSFPKLAQCAKKAAKDATEFGAVVQLSRKCLIKMEGLFSSLSYFFSEGFPHMHDYQLVLQRFKKKESGYGTGFWANTLSLWCLNPAVVFKEIADLSLSVILTSGTLSPMDSFSSELGVNFGTIHESSHEINVQTQVWASVISTGPGNQRLNVRYETADAEIVQDALGKAIEEICKVVPGGALVFFPSYNLMEKLKSRWMETDQWRQLNAQKSVYVEPRRGDGDNFETILEGYFDTIRQGRGAAFLAVCRGKISEGIDFSDDNARVVIIVGIPFGGVHDAQIKLKKEYNDQCNITEECLSGKQWYITKAFRAVNQAAGRCIRHKLDYGAVIFMDERYLRDENKESISGWLQSSIRCCNTFEESIEGLKSFFVNAKENFGKKVDKS